MENRNFFRLFLATFAVGALTVAAGCAARDSEAPVVSDSAEGVVVVEESATVEATDSESTEAATVEAVEVTVEAEGEATAE